MMGECDHRLQLCRPGYNLTLGNRDTVYRKVEGK
jgi:hypothetical protein